MSVNAAYLHFSSIKMQNMRKHFQLYRNINICRPDSAIEMYCENLSKVNKKCLRKSSVLRKFAGCMSLT